SRSRRRTSSGSSEWACTTCSRNSRRNSATRSRTELPAKGFLSVPPRTPPMRRFLIVGHRASTSPDFPLDDLAGGAGRMDLLLTAANAALLVSHDLRRDSEATLVFLGSPDPPRTIRLDGARLQSLSPDLRTNAGLIRRALAHGARLERQTSPGVFASRRGVADVIAEISGPLIHLRE